MLATDFMSDHHLSNKSFSALGMPEALLRGTHEAGFEFCTPVQAETLPLALAGHDVAGQAQTGTGKTAAFLLAAFNRLLTQPAAENRRPNQPRAIMLAPTRELAAQIHKDAEVLGRHTGLKLGLVYGGTGYDTQRQMLEEGVDVLIGTPGRIIDYFKQRVFDLAAVQVMVLDEADRMFDLGFIKDIRFLLRQMPPPSQRLSMLFSATLSYRVTELAYDHMNNPQFVSIEPDKRTADNVTQTLYHTALEDKIPLLVYLLRHKDPTRSVVFTNTKHAAETIVAWLKGNSLNAEVISGDVPQTQRLRILQDFMEGRLPVLVATDVAARGLHIPDVSHVFNFDLPQNAEDYVHRIGRTARAGASGDAVSFACERYVFSLPEIEAYIGRKLPVSPITPEMLPKLDPPAKREYHAPRPGAERGRGGRPERRPGQGRESRPGERDRRPARAAPETAPAPSQESRPTVPSEPSRPVPSVKPTVKPLLRRAGGDKPLIG
jgi:ATP-dependent RNA helicase RhlB